MRSQWRRWCQNLGLHGNDVNDAYLAASAAGAGCRLVTRDGGFKRFPGLDWWNPVVSPGN
jgi:predicted nucleic acid-binding protein